MSGYSFQNRSDIEAVLKLIGKEATGRVAPKQGAIARPRLTHGWVFLTPPGGIPARSGTTVGTAACTPYHIDADDKLTELTDNDGNAQTFTVYHMGSGAVGESAYIQAKEIFGVLVADFEDCG